MHDLGGIVAVSQYLQSTQALLTTLSHYCMLDGAFLKKIEAATNFSYGWAIADQYVLHFYCIVLTIHYFLNLVSFKLFPKLLILILFCKFM